MSDTGNELNRDNIIKKLKTIYDPEIPVDIYELGLIYDMQIIENKDVKIAMTLTSPNCPAAEILPVEVKKKIGQLSGVKEVEVEIIWDPPWNPEMMSDVAKVQLGYY
ncbi:MAG: SUF system Fe-S cluster assembly protein [Calditrichaceae bacterium]|nr:SUF system Fe-S cluster assembly protein [Calditrichaceae bacterium]MBN2709856.1 SUF system Fe-S cluster assembly protein [Calditrichaceae bacterium]